MAVKPRVVQTQNSTYLAEQWPAGFPEGKPKRWMVWRYQKSTAEQVVKYARHDAFEGNKLTVKVGERMVLTESGEQVISTSPVVSIEEIERPAFTGRHKV